MVGVVGGAGVGWGLARGAGDADLRSSRRGVEAGEALEPLNASRQACRRGVGLGYGRPDQGELEGEPR